MLFDQCFKEEIIKQIVNYFEMKENEDTTYQNLQDMVKVLRGKFIPGIPILKNKTSNQ
jgi:hypothetical protein